MTPTPTPNMVLSSPLQVAPMVDLPVVAPPAGTAGRLCLHRQSAGSPYDPDGGLSVALQRPRDLCPDGCNTRRGKCMAQRVWRVQKSPVGHGTTAAHAPRSVEGSDAAPRHQQRGVPGGETRRGRKSHQPRNDYFPRSKETLARCQRSCCEHQPAR